jgi:hypothetical protein
MQAPIRGKNAEQGKKAVRREKEETLIEEKEPPPPSPSPSTTPHSLTQTHTSIKQNKTH